MMPSEKFSGEVNQLSPQAKTLAIASGKGGVGKTWLSITLAQAFSQLGQRVLLFDGDLGLANIDIQLGLNPTRDLGDVISGKQSLETVTMCCEPGGFDDGCLAVLGYAIDQRYISFTGNQDLCPLGHR